MHLSLTGINASLFVISHNGELLLKGDGRQGNGAIATFAVVATDSGDPPKRASVPVTVHFPMLGKQGAVIKTSGGSSLILAGLGGILLVLAFVIALLVAYIIKAYVTSQNFIISSFYFEFLIV